MSEKAADQLPRRYRALAALARLIDRYIEWRKATCPVCDQDMTHIIPTGYVCMNRSCRAYEKDLATAKLMASD